LIDDHTSVLDSIRGASYSLAVASDGAGPGRPRERRVDDAALAATRDLLLEGGYRALSFERVARRAGVSRAALYRRWPAKAYLVYDAVFSTVGPTTVPDTGSLEADLLALLRALTEEFSQPAARAAITGMLADFGADGAFRDSVRREALAPTASAVRGVLERAVGRGDLAPDAPLDVLVDALGGTVFFRALVLGTEFLSADAHDLVHVLLHGTAPRSPR
jgi:AcrR family transcriptional regulator